MKSGLVPALANPVALQVPGLGSVPVLDGRGLIERDVADAGYPTGAASHEMPAVHKRWLPLMDALTTFASRYASDRRQTPYVVFGSDDQIFNTTRADLSNALSGTNGARSAVMEIQPGSDQVSYYRRQLESLKPNFVEIAQRPPVGGSVEITPRNVLVAAQSLNYRHVYGLTLPDGRRASLWYRLQPTLAEAAPVGR
jgi:hypothetical protein